MQDAGIHIPISHGGHSTGIVPEFLDVSPSSDVVTLRASAIVHEQGMCSGACVSLARVSGQIFVSRSPVFGVGYHGLFADA